MRSYRDHGALGAEMLSALDAEQIVIAFAAGHHGPCPDRIAPLPPIGSSSQPPTTNELFAPSTRNTMTR